MPKKTTVRLQDFKENPANPQRITADDFATLRRSVAKYPALLSKRQILWEGDHVINSGNKRFRALVYNAAEDQGLKIADILKDIPEDEPHLRTAALLAAMKPVEVPAAWFADLGGLSDDERRKLIAIDNIQLGEVDPEKMPRCVRARCGMSGTPTFRVITSGPLAVSSAGKSVNALCG